MSVSRSALALGMSILACNEPCIVPPCPPPLALAISVTSSATGAPIATAFVKVVSPPQLPDSIACGGGPCYVPGLPGTYQVVIGAPGYQSLPRTVLVPEADVECGHCGGTVPQRVDVALSVAAVTPARRSWRAAEHSVEPAPRH